MKLLTVNNPKIEKGEKQGILTAMLSLKPNEKTCPYRSKGCADACINESGMGVWQTTQDARQRRNDLFFGNRLAFLTQLNKEIGLFEKKAARLGMKPAVRLNGYSDLNWWKVIRLHPTVQFYDYTKNERIRLDLMPKNYHVTYSLNDKPTSPKAAQRYIEKGVNVAVVFDIKKGDPFPKTFKGYKVIDGYQSDARFLDPKGVVVGLYAIGKAKKDKTGFVVRKWNENDRKFAA